MSLQIASGPVSLGGMPVRFVPKNNLVQNYQPLAGAEAGELPLISQGGTIRATRKEKEDESPNDFLIRLHLQRTYAKSDMEQDPFEVPLVKPPEIIAAQPMAELKVSMNATSNLSMDLNNGMTLELEQEVSVSISFQQEEALETSDPLALDLDHNGFQTTGVEHGIIFDIDGDGHQEKTSFISGNDAFLALDKNKNGRIDNDKELFGDQLGASNGFIELKKYDDNLDNVINSDDAIFVDLRLLSLDNQNQQHLMSLGEAGVSAISLDFSNVSVDLNNHDRLSQLSRYYDNQGDVHQSGDLLLAYQSLKSP